jgi:hypothetical protein
MGRKPEQADSAYEYASPIDRYSQLSEWKRAWIERKSEEELKLLDEMLSRYRDARAIGRFGKLALFLIVGAFVSAAAFGKNVIDIFVWMTGGHR